MSWLLSIASNVLLASLLAAGAWLVQSRLRRPGVARVLWLLVLIKLVTPPLVELPVSYPPGLVACALGTCRCGQHVQTQGFVLRALPSALLCVWAAGAFATGWTAWRRWTGFRRLLAHAEPTPVKWQTLAARLAGELSLQRVPEVLSAPGRLPPLALPGWRQPRIVLPRDLLDRLTEPQCEALLLHELFHLRRSDHLVRLLELIVWVVYWWLPAVGWVGRRLRACEETCCDAAVVSYRPDARRDYAGLLLDVVDFADPLPRGGVPQATALSAAHDLEQRLRGILDVPARTRSARPVAAVALLAACAILPCGLQHRPAAPTSAGPQSTVAPPPAPGSDRREAPPPAELPPLEPFASMCCPS
jgi:beta-lactamase regulating signal transducer with metallopeptidase domain